MSGCSEVAKAPGEAEFEEANRLIGMNSGGIAFGDSPASQAAAAQFATTIKQMQSVMFAGGSGKSFATKGEFITYVRCTDNAIVVLSHVPELRNYKDNSVRDSLAKLAWRNAQLAVESHPGITAKHTLVMGLRGFASYGPIWEGPITGEAVKKTDSALERDRLYPFFAPAGGEAKPGSTATPVPVAGS